MASPLTIVATADAHSQSQEATKDTNYNLTYLSVIRYSGYTRYAYIKFPLNDLPAGVTITSATLSLWYWKYDASNPSGQDIHVWKQTHNDWVETEVTWNSYKSGSAWTQAGGDWVESNPAGASATVPASAGTWMDWDIKAIVEDAVTNEIDVNLVVKHEDPLGSGDYEPVFYSRDNASSNKPKLVIEYTEASAFTPKIIII